MNNLKEQIMGVIVNEFNRNRIIDLNKTLSNQDIAYLKSVEEIDKVREFVGHPENILGSNLTKHGEIAEQVEVGVRRAKSLLHNENPTATFNGVGRTAPEDYIIAGEKVQSKFINGTNNGLNHVLQHMNKYDEFYKDGYYHIPKDQYEVIEKVMEGKHVDGLNSKTELAIRKKIEEIQEKTGKSFDKSIKPSISNYKDVQKGTINKTLDNHEKNLDEENKELKKKIVTEHQPSLAEGLKASGTAAAIGGGISFAAALYSKHKEGKKFYKGEFSQDDWVDVLKISGKGAMSSGISGGSIYTLTNYCNVPAPFAAAVVSGIKGVSSLAMDLKNGKITSEEFQELGMITCSETAIVALSTAIGQTVIPIPILGSLIGSITASTFLKMTKNDKTAYQIKKMYEEGTKKLSLEHREQMQEIERQFQLLGDLTSSAFEIRNNVKLFQMSILLARSYGISEQKIIKNHGDLDRFMYR